jgi:hypothetical protein
MNRKAVVLLSGGLDSMLAVRVVLDQGIPVTGIRFITNFGCDPVTSGSCGKDVEPLVKAWGHLGFTVRMSHLGQDYIDMVKNPKYGRGKNMNPCVDCRIMMLSWAREAMDREGAGFLVTGEVLNQRPMSQTRERFRQVVRRSGPKGADRLDVYISPFTSKYDPSGVYWSRLLNVLAGQQRVVRRHRYGDVLRCLGRELHAVGGVHRRWRGAQYTQLKKMQSIKG